MQIDHDHLGRVGPPRCQECNAPLGIDDAAFAADSVAAQVLCNDCLELTVSEQDIRSFL